MPLTPLRLRLLVASLLIVSILGALDHTIVSTSLATIAGDLGALEHMGWVVVGYTLASTVLLPVLGRLGDVIDPRTIFLVSLGVFLVASLACGFAPTMPWLIAGRVVQGLSSAGIQLMSQTIMAQVTTPRQRPKYMAIIGAAFPVAVLIGPVVGGLITDFWTWPWIFWVNLPFGLAAFVLAMIAIPRLTPGARRPFDGAGAVTFTVALVGLVLTVTWLPDPELALSTLVAAIVTVIAGIAFVLAERRAVEPIVPFQLLRNRTVGAAIALSAIIGIGIFSVTAYLPMYVQMAYLTSATVSGLIPISMVFGMLVTNLATGYLASRTGHYRSYPIIGTLMGAAGLLVMALLPTGAPLWVPMAMMFVVGMGTGAFMSLIVTVVQSAVPRSETSSITATTNLVRQIGATVTTAVIGGIIGVGVTALLPSGMDAATLTPQLVQASEAATQALVAGIYRDVFVPIFFALSATYAVGVVAALLMPHGRLSDEYESTPSTQPQPA